MIIEPALQAVTILDTWHIAYHQFFAIDPDMRAEAYTGVWWFFKEDMLQLTHAHHDLLIDLGWYPAHHPDGAFRLVLIARSADPDVQIGAWDQPLATFHSRSREAVVTTLEAWIRNLPPLLCTGNGSTAGLY